MARDHPDDTDAAAEDQHAKDKDDPVTDGDPGAKLGKGNAASPPEKKPTPKSEVVAK
jgi:hypothetical protein